MPMEKRIPKVTSPGQGAKQSSPQSLLKTPHTVSYDGERGKVIFLKQLRERRSKW